MTVESDLLRNLVDNVYPATVSNLTNNITKTNEIITDLTNQKNAVLWGMDQAKTDQISLLTAKGYDLNYYESTFGVSDLSTFHLGDLIITTGITYVSDDSFDIDGDQTTTFVNGLFLIIDLGVDGYVIREVDSSVYNGPSPDTTTVTLVTDLTYPITANITNVYELLYEYLGTGWDSDANIIANINYFSDSYDHLIQPLGTSGTYGLNDKIAQLTTGKTILETDKTKYEDLIILYDRFAT